MTRSRVLVIDDDGALRRATLEILSAAGFEVWEAATGEEGARRAAALPDLVLCDVQLPDIDGFEVCRRLRDAPATAALPILFMSGIYRDTKDRVRGLREGADGFLVRPVPSDELVSTICVLLRRRAREGDCRAAAALAEVGRQLARTSTEPGALHRILGTIRDLFDARRVILYERGADGALTPVALAGAAAEIADDAVVTAPLVAYGEEIGVLALALTPGRVLAASERQLFATFADICALAAHNARLYATSQRALDQTQLLLSVVAELTEPADSVEVMRRAARLVCRVLDADTAVLFALDARSGTVSGFAGYHVPPVLLRTPIEFGVSEIPEVFV